MGANVTVHCNFSGFHSQNVFWINASNYIVGTGSNLTFLNISRRYDGEYNCSASNVCRVDSKRVYIDVQCESVYIVQIMSCKLQALNDVYNKLLHVRLTCLTFVYS